jgi:hypothetical protein
MSVQLVVIFISLIFYVFCLNIRFCYKPRIMLPFSFFYNFTQNFAILSVICSPVAIITASTMCIRTHLLCL